MSDFLLELRSEEIPARMQKGARAELEKLFRREMDAAGVSVGELTVWSTPRRLALIARDLPLATEAVREEAKGPPEGAPDQAVDGFCRKNGVTRDQLEVREVKGRNTYFAVIEKPGRETSDLLSQAIPVIIRDFSWPKSMRWGDASISTESQRWVRPLSGIVALLDGEVVDCEVAGIAAGRTTNGHRFHKPKSVHAEPVEVRTDGPATLRQAQDERGVVTISSASDYAEKLRDAHVIVDHIEREQIVRDGAAKAAADAGLKLVEDEGLVVENAGLTEWPVPLLGRFEDDFLDVPPETIQLTARVNQKYFVCEDANGQLANAFICTANIEAADPAVVVDGNRKVLAARLADARFFWELDQKKTLAQHAEGLERITFHEKLGTVADKVDRVAKLADWLVFDAKAPNGDHKLARQAAELCKADLVTEMVGEFPELQGLMGGYYAAKEGLTVEVSDAIRDHYKPVGQGDEVPTAPTTVAVSLADKLDNLLSFFKVDILPTGSKDPFALRRAALGYIRLVQVNDLKLAIDTVVHAWQSQPNPALSSKVTEFLLDRLAVQLRDEGLRHDHVLASRNWQGQLDMRIDRVDSRARALFQFLSTEDGTNLLAGYKRASNILKKEKHVTPAKAGVSSGSGQTTEMPASAGMTQADLSYSPEKAEKALMDALADAAPKAAAAVGEERFGDAMTALASLRAPIDAFFEEVTVNDSDADKRSARLDLLSRFRDAVHQVADFSAIEG